MQKWLGKVSGQGGGVGRVRGERRASNGFWSGVSVVYVIKTINFVNATVDGTLSKASTEHKPQSPYT